MQIVHFVRVVLPLAAIVASAAESCTGQHALRAATRPEWSDFPANAPARLECTLDVPEATAKTLVLRQDDVKRPDWKVTLNGRELGGLLADEHRLMSVFEIPSGLLSATGANTLVIAPASAAQLRDDIRIDRITLQKPEPAAWLSQAKLRVTVTDEKGKALPARITISDAERTLLPVGVVTGTSIAVRPGSVYTIDGRAEIPVPAGRYKVWASRGFEYSAPVGNVNVSPGKPVSMEFQIRREVRVPEGWTAGDTHLHTLERSRHGDATVAERIVSIAGEGLDWAVSTEHNLSSTYDNVPADLFVPIRGVEVTTPLGHFNVFPWPADLAVPEPRMEWDALWNLLRGAATPEMAMIWNHPRDIHSGYRPFDPARFIALAGEETDGKPFGGNAMEVVNSGAMYSHPLQLAEDWMRLLNRGRQIAAIGSSDSHTVTTFAAGQARTYVRTGPQVTGETVAAAIRNGETVVSYGLATFVEQREDRLAVKVHGPSWVRPTHLRVYANGELIEERAIDAWRGFGIQWEGEVATPKLKRDAFLVVIATGGDVEVPFWPISRPYQPVTPDWRPMILGISPALRWDGDGDGSFRTPRQQAEDLLKSASSTERIIDELKQADSAVAAQTALLLAPQGQRLQDLIAHSDGLSPRSREVLSAVQSAWKETQVAR